MVLHRKYRGCQIDRLELLFDDIFYGYLIEALCIRILCRIRIINTVYRLSQKYRLSIDLDRTQDYTCIGGEALSLSLDRTP